MKERDIRRSVVARTGREHRSPQDKRRSAAKTVLEENHGSKQFSAPDAIMTSACEESYYGRHCQMPC